MSWNIGWSIIKFSKDDTLIEFIFVKFKNNSIFSDFFFKYTLMLKNKFNIFYSCNLEICINNNDKREEFEEHSSSHNKKIFKFRIILNSMIFKM